MYNWEIVNVEIHKELRKEGFTDGEHFATFTRPNNHLIIEANTNTRERILEVLKKLEKVLNVKVVENDSWSGGNRIGIIIENWY